MALRHTALRNTKIKDSKWFWIGSKIWDARIWASKWLWPKQWIWRLSLNFQTLKKDEAFVKVESITFMSSEFFSIFQLCWTYNLKGLMNIQFRRVELHCLIYEFCILFHFHSSIYFLMIQKNVYVLLLLTQIASQPWKKNCLDPIHAHNNSILVDN